MEKILVPELILAWTSTLAPGPIPCGYVSTHTRIHHPIYNKNKYIMK